LQVTSSSSNSEPDPHHRLTKKRSKHLHQAIMINANRFHPKFPSEHPSIHQAHACLSIHPPGGHGTPPPIANHPDLSKPPKLFSRYLLSWVKRRCCGATRGCKVGDDVRSGAHEACARDEIVLCSRSHEGRGCAAFIGRQSNSFIRKPFSRRERPFPACYRRAWHDIGRDCDLWLFDTKYSASTNGTKTGGWITWLGSYDDGRSEARILGITSSRIESGTGKAPTDRVRALLLEYRYLLFVRRSSDIRCKAGTRYNFLVFGIAKLHVRIDAADALRFHLYLYLYLYLYLLCVSCTRLCILHLAIHIYFPNLRY